MGRSNANEGAREIVVESRSIYGKDNLSMIEKDLAFRVEILRRDTMFAGCGLHKDERDAVLAKLKIVARYARVLKCALSKRDVEKN